MSCRRPSAAWKWNACDPSSAARARAARLVPAALLWFESAAVAVLSLAAAAAVLSLVAPSAATEAQDDVFPGERWQASSPAEVRLDAARLAAARDYALTGQGSGYIVRGGRLVMSWGDLRRRYDLKSSTKSIGTIALGLAIADGKLKLSDTAAAHHPAFGKPPDENAQRGWLDRVTLLHLATHTAGFEKPGGYTRQVVEPGTRWLYSDSGPNWLAECITLAYRQDVEELLFERVFTPIGVTRDDLRWRANAYRPRQIEGIERREFGSGVHANVDAMARIGLLYLREGRWNDRRLLPAEFVRQVGIRASLLDGLPVEQPREYGRASDRYGLLWWNNADGALRIPRDTYWSWGLHDSLIVVMPSRDVVVARAGSSWQRQAGADHYDVLKAFLEPIAAAAGYQPAAGDEKAEPRRKQESAAPGLGTQPPGGRSPGAPYPPSPMIREVVWSDEIVRMARGSDNWPITWGDDDALYTAYGDGWGFEPRRREKLSLGLAVVRGTPAQIEAENLVSPSIDSPGDGVAGPKASGLLMVDGVLYLWARNTANAQLAWSADRGRNWTWADWKLTRSFGCPTFLNFGRNYAGAPDDFVYVYSHDHDSAYRPADRMVLARVPKDRLRERAAYEFFARLDAEGRPVWTRQVEERGSVLEHRGKCYRSSVSYNAGLKRYLWCQTLPGDNLRFDAGGADPRFRGGMAIFDAPEPWGPWTTVYFTDHWDVGPGESSHLPTKWMSEDGKTVHLVFSGDDCFSVRRAELRLHGHHAAD